MRTSCKCWLTRRREKSRSAVSRERGRGGRHYRRAWSNVCGWWVCSLSWLWQFPVSIHMSKYIFQVYINKNYFVTYTSKLFLKMQFNSDLPQCQTGMRRSVLHLMCLRRREQTSPVVVDIICSVDGCFICNVCQIIKKFYTCKMSRLCDWE